MKGQREMDRKGMDRQTPCVILQWSMCKPANSYDNITAHVI